MSASVEVVGLELVEDLQDLAIQGHTGRAGDYAAAAEETNSGECNTNRVDINNHHGFCAICLNKIVLQETALVKGCEHAYCVTCILRWASCKKQPTCPQCKIPFEFLNVHRALDGSIYDYMFEESVCLLLLASWFKPLVEAEKEELDKIEDCYYYEDDEDDLAEFNFSSSSSLRIDPDAGPSRQPKKDSPNKELVGRRAKRALKREAADKAAAAKHQQHLTRLEQGRKGGGCSIMKIGSSNSPLVEQISLRDSAQHKAMDSFTYNPGSNQEPEHEQSFSAILEIHVHHARNIHNICIYDNQDVYAKFSLTYNPDETLSTRIIDGGGKNPEFNERLLIKIRQPGAVLKCEIWMLSRVKNFMDDQLLGFALVPISSLSGKGKVTQDFALSSTDLFHSPAGTIKLSLTLDEKSSRLFFSELIVVDSCPTTSEHKKIPEEYSRIEFPDMNVVNENEQMVSEYFEKNGRALMRPWPSRPDGSFLHLGPMLVQDHEMANNNSLHELSVSPEQNSGFLSSTMTSLSDDRASADSMEKKGGFFADLSTSPDESELSTSKKGEAREENVAAEAEESVMQKQIVDMYMRSMQQFTESLAKMKLPMDLEKRKNDGSGDLIRGDGEKKIEMEKEEKKESNSRVFYGSRAFF
ncbi:RING/U-box superfamily protein [Striga asiatica]|uniref:RING/U-box superfamily protein n=1 Tax=Striga asiatica TaxID=4170 RepID=A0A5A7REG0_STRAF|nr:RING/U-box superfamily protein [Striga asiatica]